MILYSLFFILCEAVMALNSFGMYLYCTNFAYEYYQKECYMIPECNTYRDK